MIVIGALKIHIKFRNCRYYDQKTGVWCTISGRRIIGPIFYQETINCEQYVGLILQPFFAELTDEEKDYAYFIQNNATAHTANDTMLELTNIFGDCILSRGLWPPRSPDLNPCDLYLWDKLKSVSYVNILTPWMN